jgi:hypothetical protein
MLAGGGVSGVAAAAVATPDTFTALHISVTALITAAVGLPFAVWRLRPAFPGEAVVLALLAGAAVLAWRLSANMPQLNADGASPFSANDWAAPMLTYVVLSCYAGLRAPIDRARFSQVRAALTIVSLIVNVIAI